MAEAATSKKVQPIVESVKMTDGRSVDFPGKRKMQKEVLISETGVSVRFDLRNGETRLFDVPESLLYQFAGHGASQKIGDECADIDEPDDMVVAIDTIIERLNKGEWSARAPSGESFAGASVVIKAIVEASGKSVSEVKAFLQGKLDAAAAKGEKLTRAALYQSFRNPASKVGQIIVRLESEKAQKGTVSSADLEAELGIA